MLDLVFLIMLIYIFVRSLRGYYNETLCNIALVIGVLAAVVGILFTATSSGLWLNIILIVIAVGQRFAARYLARLYNDKIAQSRKELEDYISSLKRDNANDYHMDDDDFDNELLRFGKGGLTPYDEELFGDDDEDENSTLPGKKNPTLNDKK